MPELTPLPPIAGQPISVVLLAHDEEPHLEAVVTEWAALLEGLKRDYEMLLVDDGSADRTGALAEALAARLPRLHVLRHPAHRGRGAALRTALAAATKPLLFYTTADRQYQPADLKRLLAEIDKVHLVSGFRLWRPVPAPLRWLGRGWRLILRVFLGLGLEPLPGWLGGREHLYRALCRAVFALRLQDVNCAYRLCRRDIFARIPIQSDGDFVHTEVLAKANFLGCYLNDEVTVAYRPRERDARGRMWKDGYRVFARPDFGPPVLPAEGQAQPAPPA
ncbi:MAG TPA: glycosyltransferase [Gemmataceae bacterium]|nr:glycosyltransferase [Gemmataceae bacterium]